MKKFLQHYVNKLRAIISHTSQSLGKPASPTYGPVDPSRGTSVPRPRESSSPSPWKTRESLLRTLPRCKILGTPTILGTPFYSIFLCHMCTSCTNFITNKWTSSAHSYRRRWLARERCFAWGWPECRWSAGRGPAQTRSRSTFWRSDTTPVTTPARKVTNQPRT